MQTGNDGYMIFYRRRSAEGGDKQPILVTKNKGVYELNNILNNIFLCLTFKVRQLHTSPKILLRKLMKRIMIQQNF